MQRAAIWAAVAAFGLLAAGARAEQHGDGYGPRDADPREYGGGQGQYVVLPYPAVPYAVQPYPYGYPAPGVVRYPPPPAWGPAYRPLPPLRPPAYPYYAPYGYGPP